MSSARLLSLAVAAALLVAAQPLAIVDPSFLLTFGATAAIIVVIGPQGMTDAQYQSFRIVLGAMIVLGGLGFWLAIGSANLLHESLRVLKGANEGAALPWAAPGSA